MLSKLMPLLLALLGIGAGIGAGMALRPAPGSVVAEAPCGDIAAGHVAASGDAPYGTRAEEHAAPATDHDYLKMSNQFVIPVVAGGRVGALVVMSISLEIAPGSSNAVYEREPKLRDAFLQVMFDHANAGGFDGAFTHSGQMTALRQALRETARKVVGGTVHDVLILDIVRQDS